jgi:hypothetical protein
MIRKKGSYTTKKETRKGRKHHHSSVMLHCHSDSTRCHSYQPIKQAEILTSHHTIAGALGLVELNAAPLLALKVHSTNETQDARHVLGNHPAPSNTPNPASTTAATMNIVQRDIHDTRDNLLWMLCCVTGSVVESKAILIR